MDIERKLIIALGKLNISFDEAQINKLLKYLEILYEGNKRFNITGTKDKQGILTRHILDSLGIFTFLNLKGFDKNSRFKIIDIGTGPGLPGIPVSIFLKNSEFILIDSREKIIDFLESTIKRLDLPNVRAIKGRAEILAHQEGFRESFNMAVSRALGDTVFLSEIMIPFCLTGGNAIIYKSLKLARELPGIERAMEILGFSIEEKIEIKIPFLEEYRVLLVLKKEFPTLYKYPRKYDKIIKIPLNVYIV